MPKILGTLNIRVRPSHERGHAQHGWLESYHTFSFADYHDQNYMGYRSLRVINDDIIEAGNGFGMHGHKDMEIISYIVEGELEHKDSMGNGSVIGQGNFQKMSAGTGVRHGEFNPSVKNRTRLLQIWILPLKKGLEPSYQELNLGDLKTKSSLTLVASDQEKKDAIKIYQDVLLYKGSLKPQEELNYELREKRGVWIQMIKGRIDVNTIKLQQGDGASIENKGTIHIQADQEAEFLLFDLK